ncbi:Regulator of chromosome condensation repeat containing protein [Oryctes borbonicus]|uniref:Regulator of chromosome condensation repeat containing protein n=1 Tax=Oryctes borbonicus TaxID=1629725 RepID=A0A0T6B3E9_9SCAR|nr:Regulator of chromosome condensation repeat containing protein [Oryctes borbonicus]
MESGVTTNIETEWADHANGFWSSKDCDSVALRDSVQSLFDNLISNKEVRLIPESISTYNDVQALPDFQYDSLPGIDLEYYVTKLLSAQLDLARNICSSTPFAAVLKHRLLILKRIYYAVIMKYHDKDNVKPCSILPVNNANIVAAEPISGSQALVELGVQTGLTFLFSLLRENWENSLLLGRPSMCNPVLQTAVDIVDNFPPLSFSNEIHLGSLGISCLDKVSAFLKEIVLNSSQTDIKGRILASELLLSISLQRGSLRYLLEWIEMALEASAYDSNFTIRSRKFTRAIQHMMGDTSLNSIKFDDSAREITLYEAATQLMEKLVSMAVEFSGESLDESSSECKSVKNSDLYVWGSNSSQQLAEGGQERIMIPSKSKVFQQVQQAEAGQYCTFIVHFDGSVSACGKGSYGRLGLGDSANHNLPKRVLLDTNIKKISSSKGSDGHTLALTEDGFVYSWGDGDYGKLGHGNYVTHKQPKLVKGPFADKVVKCIHAGYRHSAAVTEDGLLYTWGESDHGRLGHGDTALKLIPTQVADLIDVGTVACGSAHTLVISKDGCTVWSFGSGDSGRLGHGELAKECRPKVIEALQGLNIRKVCGSAHTLVISKDGCTVWSFGSGDSGRLGHGELAKECRPKVIEALQGLNIRKVCAGAMFSMALTASGKVYTWGTGPPLGLGTSDTLCLVPTLVQDLTPYRIIDIAAGDSHCLALTETNELFAWGTNNMGQCGQGHANGPILKPQKVLGLNGVSIRQISAGTSHSLAWTAVPFENQQILRHRPFCLDLHERTFEIIKIFLEKYANNFGDTKPPPPFGIASDHRQFILMCLKLLSTHLNLCNSIGLSNSVLGGQAKALRSILFRLIDVTENTDIYDKVREVVNIGASLLLPQLKERVQLLLEQLPLGSGLSQGQQMLLNIVITSLEEPTHIASLLFLW